MAGGALVLAGQLQPNFDALTAAYVLEPSALSLLLLSTLGFLGMAYVLRTVCFTPRTNYTNDMVQRPTYIQ
jgi:hypothetical protein